MAGFRQTNPEVLKQIGENREWVQNPRLLVALVTNPKTPTTTAKRLLPRLPTSEVRRIAKSSGVPQAISAAARKMLFG